MQWEVSDFNFHRPSMKITTRATLWTQESTMGDIFEEVDAEKGRT